ncbi:adhesin [Streptomyces sp. NPDC002133]|uniref:adhesin n=1 Tax=Streptomyces sp. NPDC002133 TaxID=3154409 RepID=UPI00332864CE
MVCERCGGTHRGALPGMVTDSCTVDAVPARSRTVRESPPGLRALPTAGVVLAIGGLLAGAALLLTGGEDNRTAGAGPAVDDLTLGGLPSRVGPTSVAEDSPSPSATSPKPSHKPKPPSKPKPEPEPERSEPSAPPTFSEWVGPGCPHGVRTYGRFSDGRDGWYEVDSGGHDGDACDGRFIAVPMSGARDRDRGNTVTWNWRPGDGHTKCSVSVRIPWSPREEDVAGDPTRYNVLSDGDDGDSIVTYFQIDQPSMRGGVVVVNDLPVRQGELTIQLVDRGQDWGHGYVDGGHHAAAQIRADCTA